MGTFNHSLRLSDTSSGQSMDIEATVDTGAAYTTIPSRLLRQLGIEPMGQRQFMPVDGQRVWMDYAEARVTIDYESVTTIVVFSNDDAPPLLGAYTLEVLALAVDPLHQRLVPTHLILY